MTFKKKITQPFCYAFSPETALLHILQSRYHNQCSLLVSFDSIYNYSRATFNNVLEQAQKRATTLNTGLSNLSNVEKLKNLSLPHLETSTTENLIEILHF